MNNNVAPLGRKWFRLGTMEYTSKAGKKVVTYGLEEVRVIPDGQGGMAYEPSYPGVRLQAENPEQFRAFLLAVGAALPAKKNGMSKVTVDVGLPSA